MTKFTHIRLLVSDVQACLSFYRDVLGMEVLWADEDGH
jgi:catechol 2,3-dioxygenase-like lactoylglutathione lyase family enzyme